MCQFPNFCLGGLAAVPTLSMSERETQAQGGAEGHRASAPHQPGALASTPHLDQGCSVWPTAQPRLTATGPA